MDSSVKRRIHLPFLLLTISSMFACAVPLGLPAGVPPTAQEGVETIIARTAAAAATQTAKLFTPTVTPSLTPSPTKISSPTPTNTPTFVFFLTAPIDTIDSSILATPSTPLVISSDQYACEITGQSPDNDSTIGSNENFQTIWTLANTGRSSWVDTSVDFIYLSGTKFGKTKAADLPFTVDSGKVVSLKVTMTAPKASGTYRTVWALRISQNDFCTMSLRIVVP